MGEPDTYNILVGQCVVAHGVNLEYALIFAKGIMQNFYNDPDIGVTIQRVDNRVCDARESH